MLLLKSCLLMTVLLVMGMWSRLRVVETMIRDVMVNKGLLVAAKSLLLAVTGNLSRCCALLLFCLYNHTGTIISIATISKTS